MRFFIISFVAGLLLACVQTGRRPDANGQRGRAVFDSLYLLPASDADTAAMRYLQRQLADSLHIPVVLKATQALPPFAWYAPRKRYWADSLLHWLRPMVTSNNSRLLLVTSSDISTTRKGYFNWGILGLAFQPGRVAVVSDYRLQEYGRPAAAIRAALLKIALHELGHTVGNGHCAVPFCLMQDADGHDKTASLTGFCRTCRQRLFKP